MTTRWESAGSRSRGADYAARFEAKAAAGADVHGEAGFCAGLVPRGSRVLDAGCGTGRVAKRLQALGYSCAGIDSDASMLGEAMRDASVAWTLGDLSDAVTMSTLRGRFDLVVAAGNVVPLVAAGSEATVVRLLALSLAPGGVLVAGFGLDAAHLPLPEAPFGLGEYDGWCAAAGLQLQQRWPTWDGVEGPVEGYAVSVHRRGPSPGLPHPGAPEKNRTSASSSGGTRSIH